MKKVLASGFVLGTVILMDVLVGVEFDLFVPSFPEIQRFFDISPVWTEALLSVNFIGYCGSVFVVGSLADRYGRKPVILAGLAIFIAGSLLCLGGTVYRTLCESEGIRCWVREEEAVMGLGGVIVCFLASFEANW